MKDVSTNCYIEITRRDGHKQKIPIALPKEDVEAGLYDYAKIHICNGEKLAFALHTGNVTKGEDNAG